MLVIILYVGFPLQGAIRDITAGIIDMSRVTRGIVGISLGYAAYMAEIFRAGIEAIPKGQFEAARSLGLNGWQTAFYIVLPQALKIVIPPLGKRIYCHAQRHLAVIHFVGARYHPASARISVEQFHRLCTL